MASTTTVSNRINWIVPQAYLQLIRPANIITAWADILAGYGVGLSTAGIALLPATELKLSALFWLLLSTTGLYGGGVTFNDVFDASLDAVERPERPIPNGQVSSFAAACLGAALLTIGIGAATQVSLISGVLAGAIALFALTYDKFSKHHTVIGPLNMGFCRGLNLLLGVSVATGQIQTLWILAIIPLGYIGAITAISQGEVNGSHRSTALAALLLLSLTIGALFALSYLPEVHIWNLLPFILLLGGKVFPPFVQAANTLSAHNSREAVKAGVLALIVLDASIVAGFAGWQYGLAVLGLLPLSKGVSRLLPVT
jgi:4-hydroxybenzoate polyprenyltransferase